MRERSRKFTIALALEGRKVVVIGGGSVASRRVAALAAAGAEVTVVAPDVTPEIAASAARTVRKRFEPSDLDDAWLVFAATNDPAVNAAVAAESKQRRIAVNVADAPDDGDFVVPSSFRSGRIDISVMTDGDSPALARSLRQRLERAVGEEFSLLAEILALLRPLAKAQLMPEQRRALFTEVASEENAELLRRDRAAFRDRLQRTARSFGFELPPEVDAILTSATSSR